MEDHNDITRAFESQDIDKMEVSLVLKRVCSALRESGYDPLDQIVGYLISGDPAYITNHNNARVLIRQLARDQIIEALVKNYLEGEII